MAIIPGTTPMLTVVLDASITGCSTAELCIRCGGVQIVKTFPALRINEDGTEVRVRLSQKETLLFPDDSVALVQLRVLIGRTALATELMQVSTKELLDRKELTAHGE